MYIISKKINTFPFTYTKHTIKCLEILSILMPILNPIHLRQSNLPMFQFTKVLYAPIGEMQFMNEYIIEWGYQFGSIII